MKKSMANEGHTYLFSALSLPSLFESLSVVSLSLSLSLSPSIFPSLPQTRLIWL